LSGSVNLLGIAMRASNLSGSRQMPVSCASDAGVPRCGFS
jgi:hypothetical protein